MHKHNTHKSGYDFEILCKACPDLTPFVFINTYQTKTIDFANPKAVKALNTALLFAHYKIGYWNFPEDNLCPPIPGRVDYIHHLAELLKTSGICKDVTILDIGTGASCIYPILGHAVYDWNFIATDIDKRSLAFAQKIINENKLSQVIELRHQADKSQILKEVLHNSERFSASMCNPPFFKSDGEAQEATHRKLKGLGNTKKNVIRNFSGNANELWYKGGEKAFVHNYLYESSLFKSSCFWFTSLVSNKDNVKSMYASLKKLGATTVKTIDMHQGNKITRIVAWTFLSKDEQKQWRDR